MGCAQSDPFQRFAQWNDQVLSVLISEHEEGEAFALGFNLGLQLGTGRGAR